MKKVSYSSGGQKIQLHESAHLLVVRTRKKGDLKKNLKEKKSKEVTEAYEVKHEIPRAGITILELKKKEEQALAIRDEARAQLKQEQNVQFAGRVLVDSVSREPVLYTENIFVQFDASCTEDEIQTILNRFQLRIKEKISYAPNTYFLQAPEGCGMNVFTYCQQLNRLKKVVYCEPELIRQSGKKKVRAPKIHPAQWHLKSTVVGSHRIEQSASVEAAHALSTGKGICIAIIDDGVDIRHEEFSQQGKVIHPVNIADKSPDCSPRTRYDNHGTCCAGVACASGVAQACGVAPHARLMPIRNDSELGSKDEADAIAWAVDHGADIISCSWGPLDGEWWKPRAALHRKWQAIAPLTSEAIRYAVQKGRKGKGCVVLFAAGNGNESADLDQYISHPDVIAVAACNDRGTRSVYSDFGKAVWVCFPSNDFEWEEKNHVAPLTPGIWTTDRTGSVGYKRSQPADYHPAFGGTSSACPGVAGVCALILSVRPELTQSQVRQILKESAEPIDQAHGRYSKQGHSIWYGYGRVHAERAVNMALRFSM